MGLALFIFWALSFSPTTLYSWEKRIFATDYGEIIIENLKTAPFPHETRESGYTYRGQFFSKEKHYNDNSVFIFIPKQMDKVSDINFVFYFHGWNDSLVMIPPKYKIISQFAASHRDAILVIPQGPLNAPDSSGGKLEDVDGFKEFVDELLLKLYEKNKIQSKRVGSIVLSGHSGGFRVMSYILLHGGYARKIKEVYLFDGLYSQLEKFVYWINYYEGKFINVFTRNEYTLENSLRLIEDFDGWNIPYLLKDEEGLTKEDLLKNRVFFIFTEKDHNEVMHDSFKKFLYYSCLPKLKPSQGK
ncbi:MAG: hypothetical protein H7A25_18950 [Leptospiraceae bacterium]|nr:hypothetical protein [Leptospiraceae bacterium]MCP5501988.1 hypothetical protein [Leptospiraceae bacterium]